MLLLILLLVLLLLCLLCFNAFLHDIQANLGVAQLLLRSLQQRGLSAAAAKSRLWLVDSKGLITTDRSDLTPQKAAFAQDVARLSSRPSEYSSSTTTSATTRGNTPQASHVVQQQLAGIVELIQPSALIGAAGVPGAFGQPVLQALVQVGMRRMY